AVVVGAADGLQTVLELTKTVGGSLGELQVVLQGLVGIGVITLSPAQALWEEADAEDETVKFDLNELQEKAR
ncbi:MAG TPA: hypothetical protein DFS52_22595, partial [Myxococcales bacterium]|nr:hypothetical protein [Myxococcales bacterium]